MSLVENALEIFGASFHQNQLQVKMVYTTWSVGLKQ
jgi:hypothetical protein